MNEGATTARFTALVCHPHPLGGGTMHNKVVYHAMKTFNTAQWGLAWPVLRFNFRGTGLSEGIHDGVAEWEDVASALAWLETEYKLPIIAAGFSFGSAMILKACCEKMTAEDTVRGVVALGLPTLANGIHFRYDYLQNCSLPKLFVSGNNDAFAPEDEWRRVTGAVSEPKTQVLLPGADHFFTGHLDAMQSALSGWLTERFQ